jgi:glutaredoxin
MSDPQTEQNENYEFYVLYVKDGCDFCQNATELLKEKEKSFVITDMTFCDRALQDYKKFVQHDTVPIVQHIKHKFIPHLNSNMPVPAMVGGFDDLVKYLENGEPHAENVFSPFRQGAQGQSPPPPRPPQGV